MIVNSSVGDVGTRRMTIFLPSVEPIPIEAIDRIEAASENILPDPLSLKMYDPVRGNGLEVGWPCIWMAPVLLCAVPL